MTFRWMLRKNVLHVTLESNLIPTWEKAYSNTQCYKEKAALNNLKSLFLANILIGTEEAICI